MYFFYNITVHIVRFVLKRVAFLNEKLLLFVKGREDVFSKLKKHFSPNDNILWFHCASLGEFEQGRPIIEKCKREFQDYKILITFFSPSGYEIRKNYSEADLVTYLPLDTVKNMKLFLQIVNPKLAIFVKYEFWPNLLKQLKINQVSTILISGIFRKEQSFFKNYGGWMKKSLLSFDHFFVQDKNSEALLNNIGLKNVIVSGDTRFDRVFEITKQRISLEIIENFIDNKVTFIAGSTWPKDEELLINFINNESDSNQKFIIAPHNINTNEIEKFKKSFSKKVVLYSESTNKNLSNFQVLIVDTIGLLSQIYNYADIAYVGGGFGAGIHNILEPATFGTPIIIGPNYHKFKEAKELVNKGACKVITKDSEFKIILNNLFNDTVSRKNIGQISRNYINENIGSSNIIYEYINKRISKK